MTADRVPMTVDGAENLRRELHELKSVQRPKVIEDIATAREHGDLKENAEYHAAREQQSFIEGRIHEIESKLANAQIVDVSTIPNNGKVIFGCTVSIINTETDAQLSYKIVGDDEADIKQGKLSFNSPIARGLIGKVAGDIVDISTPGGINSFEIDSVEYV